jgi:RNA polymerase sigma-70 factor (ECF subfamily)
VRHLLRTALADISTLLDLSVSAVKAALHRGRARLREISISSEPIPPPSVSPALIRYAALFNARDWDGVRAMLVDDVKLDLISREKRSGRRQVGHYFTNYGRVHDRQLVPGRLDGREVLAVFRRLSDARPGYFIELNVVNGRVAAIRDFRYVPYIGRDAEIELVRTAGE